MKKLSKRATVFVAIASIVAAAAVAIPIGVIYGTSSSQTASPTLIKLDRTKTSTSTTWGTDPALIAAPALTAEETASFSDYEPGVFVASNLTKETIPGSKDATVTFSYKSKSPGKPTLQVTYSLEVLKAIPSKPWPSDVLLQTDGDGWLVAKGSDLAQSVDEAKVVEFLKANGFTGYSWDPATVKYYADLEATTELTQASFGLLVSGGVFYAKIGFSLDTVHYSDSALVTNEDGTSTTVNYPVSGSLKAKFTVRDPAVKPAEAELTVAPLHYQYSRLPVITIPSTLGTGYKLGNWLDMVVTAQKSPIQNEFSPPVGFRTDQAYDLSTLNAGTEFDLKYEYVPAPGYIGEKLILTAKFVVDQKKEDGTAAYWADRDQPAVDTISYRQGDDPSPAVSLAPFDIKVYLDKVAYYLGDTATGDPVSAARISSLQKDQTFTAVLSYKTTPNFVFIGSPLREDVKVTRHFKVGPPAYRVDKTGNSIEIAWSTDPKTIAVPPLTGDVFAQFADYGPGSVLKSTTTSATEIGDRAGTITFVYPATSGSGATVQVTYSVDIVKATPPKPWPADNQSTVTITQKVTVARENGLPVKVSDTIEDPEKYLSSNGYVGYSVDRQETKYTTDELGKNEITLQQYQALAAGSIVFGRFTIKLDTSHYSHEVSEGKLVVSYKVQVQAAVPQQVERTEAPVSYPYKTAPDISAPAPQVQGYGTGTIKEIEVTDQKSTLLLDENSPAEKSKITENSKLSLLNAGTSFKVTWSYLPDENHYGSEIRVSRIYTVARAIAQPLNFVPGPVKEIVYGDTTASQTPPKATVEGYNDPVFKNFKITAKSAVAGENSPEIDAEINELNKAEKFNWGTEFTANWTYSPITANYIGGDVTLSIKYKIIQKTVPDLSRREIDGFNTDVDSYKIGQNPDDVISGPLQYPYLNLISQSYFIYSNGRLKSVTIAYVKSLHVFNLFVTVFVYELNPNYKFEHYQFESTDRTISVERLFQVN